MNLAKIEQEVHPLEICYRVLFYEETASTRQEAARLAAGPDWEDTLIIADHQTAGKGTHGRPWFDSPGDSILVSLLLHPRPGLRTLPLSRLTAEALADGIQAHTGVRCTLREPNDVLIGGKKVAGVLAETSCGGNAPAYWILSFGLNVHVEEFPSDLAATACSLHECSPRPPEREALLIEILRNLDERLQEE